MTDADLEALLNETLSSDVPHVTKVTVSVALVAEVLRRRGMTRAPRYVTHHPGPPWPP
jgi:hypothetical protein